MAKAPPGPNEDAVFGPHIAALGNPHVPYHMVCRACFTLRQHHKKTGSWVAVADVPGVVLYFSRKALNVSPRIVIALKIQLYSRLARREEERIYTAAFAGARDEIATAELARCRHHIDRLCRELLVEVGAAP